MPHSPPPDLHLEGLRLEQLRQQLGSTIRRIRVASSLTLSDMADSMMVSVSHMDRIERGEVELMAEQRVRLKMIFGIDL